jgi:hypothetical protein
MPAELAIQWMKTNYVVGGPLPSGTLVWVRSRHLLNPPLAYRIYRLNPKPWWKPWGREVGEETVLDAVKVDPGPNDPGGLYRSNPDWSLPVPEPTNRPDARTSRLGPTQVRRIPEY